MLLTFLVAGWLVIFCQQCFSSTEPVSAQFASCCPDSAQRAVAATAAEPCSVAPQAPCVMAKAMDPQGTQTAADIKFNSVAKAAAFALFLVLAWRLVPTGPAPTVLRNAARPFYDPRRLERTRLLLI